MLESSSDEDGESSFDDVSLQFTSWSERAAHFIRTSTPKNGAPIIRKLSRSFGSSISPRSTSNRIRRESQVALLDRERSTNSQGYNYFLSQPLYRRHSLHYLWSQFSTLLSSIPRNVHTLINSSSVVEEARGGNSREDEIDLSELFPNRGSRDSGREQTSVPSKTGKRSKMGSLYRSEVMKLCQMIITKESAYDCVAEVGKNSNVQFNDLNSHLSLFQRSYVRDVRRCEELERSLRFLERQIADCVPPIELQPIDAANLDVPTSNQIKQIESRVFELEKSIGELNGNDRQLRKNLNENKEYQYVLQKVENFFQVHLETEAMHEIEEAERSSFNDSFRGELIGPGENIPLTPNSPTESIDRELKDNAWFIAGVIPFDKKLAFERVLWRACRRTAFVRMAEIDHLFEDPDTLAPIQKTVFIIFFKGEQLKMIVNKVCEGFNAREYPCPKSSKERQSSLIDTITRIQDLQVVIDSTQTHRRLILAETAVFLPDWLKQLHIHKAVFHSLNNFTVDTNGFLAAECWIPEIELESVREAMKNGVRKSGTDVAPILNMLETVRSPPTYNNVNKFTKVFQSIVDSYGVANYREINPAPYTIITFPFLFAVMFGDFAHGIILLASGLFFVLYEKKLLKSRIRDEIFCTFFGGRYIIVLMGLFSIYTGMIYNDGFAKSFNVFGSRWQNPYNSSSLVRMANTSQGANKLFELLPDESFQYENGAYPFGVDPVWNIAENRLNFLNSMKMKASVIIGIAQMTFGVFLSLLNYSHSRSFVDIFTNFLPQLVFLSSIFVYLCVQIIAKWIFVTYEAGEIFGMEYEGAKCAPSLLIGLINMFMLKHGPVGLTSNDTSSPCYLHQWYPHQSFVEQILLITALLCIPIMLLGKPMAEWISQKRKHTARSGKKGTKNNTIDEEALVGDIDSNGKIEEKEEGNEHSMSDVVVHQAIHTIEFVLGCVSHTASYLRLWALSLAHAQLSEVLWHMVLMQSVNYSHHPIISPLLTFIGFFVFGVLTISILVLMEGLSAFLHALRLHWVEFQSKFYYGGGYPFTPFSLQQSIENAQYLSQVDDITNKE